MKSALVLALLFLAQPAAAAGPEIYEFDLPAGAHPHDVAPAPDGGVWYTAQHQGALGYLDPATGKVRQIPLGEGSSPHGVIVGPDGAPWVTDSGLNAVVRVDPKTERVKRFPLPIKEYTNLNTATFDSDGTLWFTGQGGYYGRLEPQSGTVEVFNAPRGRGPYGIATTSDGEVWYASLAGSHIARIDTGSGRVTIVEPPTPGQGARRVWGDSLGYLWVSEWNAGQLSLYNAKMNRWQSWKLPGRKPQAYAVYVDDQDKVWLSDFGGDVIFRFDPVQQTFTEFKLPTPGAKVRQILGRPGEIWLPESATDKLAVICEPCPFRKAAPAAAQDFSLAQLNQSPRHHEWAKIPSGGRTLHAFVAYPEKAKKTLAVIVIHENRGLTDWVRSAADQLAAAGYLAIAPDLLSGFDAAHGRTSDFADGDQARTAIYDLDPDQITGDLLAVQKYVAALPASNGRTAVIGFCWGGGQSFRFATIAPGLSAALVFYGPAPTDEARLKSISAPVYGFYGALDERIDATIPKTREQMKALGKRYEPVIYDGAGHAFMRQGDDPAGPDAVKKARDDAWERIRKILAGIR